MEKETHELIFSHGYHGQRYCSWARTHDDGGVVQHGGHTPNKYMLLAGWEVSIGKKCDRGLENAARGRRPSAAFSSPRSQFFPIRTDPKPANNILIFFSCSKLAYKWVCLHNFAIESAYAPSTNHSQKM